MPTDVQNVDGVWLIACIYDGSLSLMTSENQFNPEDMLRRFRERAESVKRRNLPPVGGEERKQFLRQAQIDFQDFSIIGDAEASLKGGVLQLTVDLRA